MALTIGTIIDNKYRLVAKHSESLFGEVWSVQDTEDGTEQDMEVSDRTIANQYQLIRRIGSGGFADIWKAYDSVTKDNVALKIYHPREDINSAQFIVTDYKNVKNIHHANLLTPNHAAIIGNLTPYLVMELCQGDISEKEMDENEVWRLIKDVAAGLVALSENTRWSENRQKVVADPIIHRDIKPTNILRRNNGQYAIADFGISQRTRSSLSSVEDGRIQLMDQLTSAMTIEYAAPERFPTGNATVASDIWSLGATLYELVEGKRPYAFVGGNALNDEKVKIPRITQSGYSSELRQLIYDCMAPTPADRPTAKQLYVYADQMLTQGHGKQTWQGAPDSRKEEPRQIVPNPKPIKKYLLTIVVILVVGVLSVVMIKKCSSSVILNDPADTIEANVTTENETRANVSISAVDDAASNTEEMTEELMPTSLTPTTHEVTRQPASQETKRKNSSETASSNVQSPKQTVVQETAKLTNSTKKEEPTDSQKILYKVGNDYMLNINGVKYLFKYVEGGTFTMGCPEGEECREAELPQHQVSLPSYYIGETEVTQALWKEVMGDNPSHFKGDNLPVEQVSYDECWDFIKILNERVGLRIAVGQLRFQMPTEAQWEYAARGGKHSNKYTCSGSNYVFQVSWNGDNSGDRTHDVKTKKGNELGLYDMSGNVYEWCVDTYYDYSSTQETNPVHIQERTATIRIIRGGCWKFFPYDCSVFFRSSMSKFGRNNYTGLRLCLNFN